MYTKDSTSHMQIGDAIKIGDEVTPGKVRQWRQCDSCMKEFNVDIDETPLHVTRDCQKYAHFKQELYRASTDELRQTWPTCFWCAGIAPRDKEVHSMNAQFSDFNYDEPDPPTRT